jgi:leucyl aminopeptidase
VRILTSTAAPDRLDADTVAVGLFEGEDAPPDLAGGALAALVESGEARRRFRKLAHTHVAGVRWIAVGLGDREDFDSERARVAGALVHGRARDLRTRRLAWLVPDGADAISTAAALTEGTLLAAYRFDRYKRGRENENGAIEALELVAAQDVSESVASAEIVADAANAARDLQNTPANDMTPTSLAQRAMDLDRDVEGVQAQIDGRDALLEREMGAFAAVAQGSYEEPRLITLRYEGPQPRGPLLGFVGKAVTFDSGGISIKPSAKMHEMKFDMSGGAAVLEAAGAIARLRLPVRLLAVVGATENMPSGRSVKPGDIVRAMDGTSIEVNNTDAEGRLVLADCLCWAREQGAERLVDVATLTGAILVALGSTHAGLMGSDDAWCEEVEAAARSTGEIVWRLPLHPEYEEMIKGRYGDIVNAVEQRKAGSITAAHFLARFAGEVPWAHLDIAGTAWDLGRPYAGKGGSGFGVRLLVELARRVAARAEPPVQAAPE